MSYESSKLEFVNLSENPISHVSYNIQYNESKEIPPTRFHAQYRRENPATIDKNYTILDADGTGRNNRGHDHDSKIPAPT